jgi:Flp pilus assembly protein TadG
MRDRHIRNGRRRGSVILEAALNLMVLLTLVLGCFDFGFVLFQYQTLTDRARYAARYGVIHPTDVAGMQNLVLFYQTSLPTGASTTDPGLFGLTRSMVTVSHSSAGLPEERITIDLSGYRFMFVAPFIAGSFQGKPIRASLSVEGV